MGIFWKERLQKRREDGLIRALTLRKNLVDLTSNDYFGFASSQDLTKSDQLHTTGATGSRLLTGNHSFYEEVERKIAHFHHAESCLIYNSGYTANLGLLSALGTKEVTFLYDLEIHASMIDGMKLSEAKCRPFRHQDLTSLESRLKEASLPVFVLIESIYSMSGDIAPLREIAALTSKYGAGLIVDEAHATGVRGENGEGLVFELGLESHIFARMHTFSKALGVHGACVLGSCELKEYLVNFSRPLIYTTALPYPLLFLINEAYEKLQREAKTHQRRLKELMRYFQDKLSIQGTETPIQPIYASSTSAARALAHKLQNSGLDIRPIVSPTVKKGKECVRIVLHSFNREEEIDQLQRVLHE